MRRTLAAVVGVTAVAFAIGGAVASGSLKTWANPDLDRTEGERRAAHEENSHAFSIPWSPNVPAHSTIPSSSITTMISQGGYGYIW